MQRCHSRKPLSLLLLCEDITTDDIWVSKPSQQLCCFLSLIVRLINLQSRFVRRKGKKFQLVICQDNFPSNKISNWARQKYHSNFDKWPLSKIFISSGLNGDWIKFKAPILGTCINLLAIERYKRLIEDTYTQLRIEDILGCYLHQQKGEEHTELLQKTKKKVLKRKEVTKKDIRNFSAPVSTVSLSKRSKASKAIIEIDLKKKKEKSLLYNILYNS